MGKRCVFDLEFGILEPLLQTSMSCTIFAQDTYSDVEYSMRSVVDWSL